MVLGVDEASWGGGAEVLDPKPDDSSLILGTHMIEGENCLPQIAIIRALVCVLTHTCNHTFNRKLKTKQKLNVVKLESYYVSEGVCSHCELLLSCVQT